MSDAERVKQYDSQSEAYHHAFQVFLDHTDQKVTARARLEQLIQSLSTRRILIDAGAGEGQLTSGLAPAFERTIAIEPNPHLRHEFQQCCPDVELRAGTITSIERPPPADFVLCSHVFYYITPAEWMRNLETLVSWLTLRGVAVVVLQNAHTDCMQLLDHFLGQHFDLLPLSQQFQRKHATTSQVTVETVQAYITTADLHSAYIVAEFMLNLLPVPETALPSRTVLEEYVEQHFRDRAGGYRFSCHQDFLWIRKERATT